MQNWGAFLQPLLQRKSYKNYILEVYVFLVLVIRNAMSMRHFVICGLPRSALFFHIISLMTKFSKNHY